MLASVSSADATALCALSLGCCASAEQSVSTNKQWLHEQAGPGPLHKAQHMGHLLLRSSQLCARPRTQRQPAEGRYLPNWGQTSVWDQLQQHNACHRSCINDPHAETAVLRDTSEVFCAALSLCCCHPGHADSVARLHASPSCAARRSMRWTSPAAHAGVDALARVLRRVDVSLHGSHRAVRLQLDRRLTTFKLEFLSTLTDPSAMAVSQVRELVLWALQSW